MRLLFCATCKSVEQVPDYNGTNPVDPIVEGLIWKHTDANPLGHGGSHLTTSPFRLGHVTDQEWAANSKKALEKAAEENKKAGFSAQDSAWMYDAHDTYKDDAMKCYNNHHRPAAGCIDYRDESKRLGHPTPEGRKHAKENYKLAESDPALCDFCVCRTWVQTQVNFKRKLYR